MSEEYTKKQPEEETGRVPEISGIPYDETAPADDGQAKETEATTPETPAENAAAAEDACAGRSYEPDGQNGIFEEEPPAISENIEGDIPSDAPEDGVAVLRKKAGKARLSLTAGIALLCVFCSLLAGCLGVFIGLRMANTSLSFDAIVRRLKANTGNGVSDGTVAQVAAAAAPSTVTVQVSFDDATVAASSSGVVIARDGNLFYIVCCAHGVVGYPYLRIRTEDGTDYRAELAGADQETDLAVLKVTAPDLRVALPGGNAPVMGESVVVLGNPLGNLGISASYGIVSRTLCTVKVGDITQELMKLDCAVNPGNSGGGVFDMEGHLIGIISAKITEYEGVKAEGMAFAVPMETVLSVAGELIGQGYVAGRPTAGLHFLTTPGAEHRYDPLTVSETLYGEDGETPLLLPGDILLSASYPNGRAKTIYPAHTSAVDLNRAEALANLRTLIACGEVGDTLRLTVKRGTDTPFEVVITLRTATGKADA